MASGPVTLRYRLGCCHAREGSTAGDRPDAAVPRSVNRPTDAVDPRKAWLTVAMVFLFMLVNFADKAVVGLSSTAIMSELGLSHTRFGMLGSAFFWLFAISGVAVGFLANRLSTKRIM